MEEEEETPNEETNKLFGAVREGDEALVEVLLLGNENKQFKLDLNFQFKDLFGWAALHYAAERGFEKIVKILVEHGSNVDLQDQDGGTALHMAVCMDLKEVVKILIEHGSNVHLQNEYGMTALHYAATKGFKEIVKILVEHGSNIHLQNSHGKTVLDVAKDQNIVELIIQLKGRTIKPAQRKKEN